MNGSKLRPKVVLWWGIGLTLGGLLLAVLVPQVLYASFVAASGPTPLDQALLTVVDVLTRVFAQGVVPLGVALIGASIVMAYVGRLLAPAAAAAPVEER